jgi:hypothetical protein
MQTSVSAAPDELVTKRREHPPALAAPLAPTHTRNAEQSAGFGAAVGGSGGFVLMTVAVTVLAYTGGANLREALGMGLFCAFWGGLGFGCMMGATIAVVLCQDREAELDAAQRPAAQTHSPVDKQQPRSVPLDATVHAA